MQQCAHYTSQVHSNVDIITLLVNGGLPCKTKVVHLVRQQRLELDCGAELGMTLLQAVAQGAICGQTNVICLLGLHKVDFVPH